MEANKCLKSFCVETQSHPVPARFIEHLCVNETLTELTITATEADCSKLVIVPPED